MAQPSFIRADMADGATLINLSNVTVVVIDENGSFGVDRRVTVHLVGGATLDFPEEYGDRLLDTLRQLDESGQLALTRPRG
ncbi:MAG: hypothetical protein M3Q29_17795 [Chloroflexota bacterium]|nr:hypothetical protein [Chloroflexota bacterium]